MHVLNNRGSTMVEAALVFPLVIGSVIAVILILSFFHMEAVEKAQMHVELRNHAGEAVKTEKIGNHVVKKSKIKEEIKIGHKINRAIRILKFGGNFLIKGKMKELEGRVYQIKEKKVIRYVDFFKNP